MVAFVVAFTGGSISWSVMVLICGSISWSMVLQLSAHLLWSMVAQDVARCCGAWWRKMFDCGRICIEWRIRPTLY